MPEWRPSPRRRPRWPPAPLRLCPREDCAPPPPATTALRGAAEGGGEPPCLGSRGLGVVPVAAGGPGVLAALAAAGHRQPDGEGRAPPGGAGRLDLAAHCPGQLAGDVE